MPDVAAHLDEIEQKIMNGLKDFQRATVERIDYLFKNNQKRILVSDEVGLGKTLIARGTVAKMAKLRKQEGDDLFKVVYICSNGAIADQNLRKLQITHEARTESTSSSRLSMQHLNIFRQENDPDLLSRYIQLIPLTPDTSFRMTNGKGMVSERALMYAILEQLPELNDYLPELENIMMSTASQAWKAGCKDGYIEQVKQCDKQSNGKYIAYMTTMLRKELACIWKDGMTYLDAIKNLCLAIRHNQAKQAGENTIIGHMRMIFAKISLDKLEPDLVIMDEFQRFRYLLDAAPESEVGMLTNKFFHSDHVRMLMLSATPYKMYSTVEEIDETRIDEHYTEFLTVMRFLNEDSSSEQHFLTVWRDYSIRLKEMTVGDTSILSAKREAEDAMYQTVCRTERVTEKQNADIIDDSNVHIPLKVMEQDIRSYVNAQHLLDEIGFNMHIPIDYIKSCPYLMSFMRDYKLKQNIERYFTEHKNEIRKVRKDTLWLNPKALNHYEKIQNNNARLDRVMDIVLQRGYEKLLWLPPSRPYYELQGAFKDTADSTKTLIFSSWEMVPRMLASLISYEAERRTVGKLSNDNQAREVKYFHKDEKRYPPARMNFVVSNGEPAAMTLFCLIYPSRTLADVYEPIACMNENIGIREIKQRVRRKLEEQLKSYPAPQNGNQDKAWYYIAPMLLDGEEYVKNWFDDSDKLTEDKLADEEKEKKQSQLSTYLNKLKSKYLQAVSDPMSALGKRPDDLIEVLTDMAVASPATCAYRMYRQYAVDSQMLPPHYASQVARLFINRMNTAEATAVIELVCGKKSDDAHWQNLLTYCCQGNLQAVFDEYAHLISNGMDDDSDRIAQMHQRLIDGLNTRTTTPYRFDTYQNIQHRIEGQKDQQPSIRTHFALAFTKGDGNERDTDRKKVIRDAFNSPFWPFVLASTSIGQEGLDFHNYCRRIVHWNLPANPIDLEQREGRINRFECLAIRQNVAKRYGSISFQHDVWKEMFEQASIQEKTGNSSDLIPFWGLNYSEDMIKIERIVPMYPSSRDELAYERLIKILSVYRLTLGQARQEELLEYLFQNCDAPEQLKDLFINLSPYYRQNAK